MSLFLNALKTMDYITPITRTKNQLILVFFIAHLLIVPLGSNAVDRGSTESWTSKLEPATPAEYRVSEVAWGANGTRRQLTPFQLCLPCKCCAQGVPTPMCTTVPCCFGIDCQLPNKPFGVCAFVPKTCTCTSCAV